MNSAVPQSKNRDGRPSLSQANSLRILVELSVHMSQALLDKLRRELMRRTGLQVGSAAGAALTAKRHG